MKTDDALLKIISNETKNSIDQLPIVTPSIFASVFTNFAKKHNHNFENEFELSHDLMEIECSALTALQSQASKSAKTLSDSTDRAISAIQEKDEKVLKEVLEETRKLRKEVEKLRESIYRDELTHAYNRKWFHDNYLNDKGKLNSTGVMAIIDLNYFKIVNDTHGHVIGDKVLIFIANQFKKTSYPVVRYGGDEFLILFPSGITQDQALKKLDKLRENVLLKKLKAHDETFKTSFSFGTVFFEEGNELNSAIEIADKNMYEDKISIKKRIPSI